MRMRYGSALLPSPRSDGISINTSDFSEGKSRCKIDTERVEKH